MTAVKQSTVSGDLRKNNDRKIVVSKVRKSPAPVKNVGVDVFGRRIRNQIERIRSEDSHLGEDIGECLIAKFCGATYDHDHDEEDVVIFSRPASPLSGKVPARRINMV